MLIRCARQNFRLPLWLAWVLLWVSISAVTPAQDFQRITTDQTISEVDVTDIVQDQQGFLWVGTRSGLFRYDGYRFAPYVHDPQNPASLGRNEVYSLFLDHAGRLWIGLDDGGLDLYDPQINGFIHFRHDPNDPASLSHNTVRGIWEDQAGQIWIGSRFGGVNVLDPATGNFTRYRHDPRNPDSLCADIVYQGLQDHADNLWLATYKGLEQFDPATRRFIHRTPAPDGTQLVGANVIVTLAEDRAGYLWLGSLGGGMYRYDRATDSFKTYRHSPSQPGSLGSDQVLSLLVDSHGVLWVGHSAGGLDRYDPATESFIHFHKDRQNPRSLPDDRVHALFEDRTGIIWIGTMQGLCKYDPLSTNFVTAHPALDSDKLKEASVLALMEDRAGQFWIGTNRGLAHFDPANGRVMVYQHDPARADSLNNNNVSVIYQDSAGRIWISGDFNELNLYLPSRQGFKRYPLLSSLSSQSVFAMYEDKQGRLLISLWLNGLQQYDAATDSFVPFQPRGLPQWVNKDTAIALREDHDGQLWLGMRFGGALRYDPATDRWTNYRQQAGDPRSLSDNQVADLLVDHQGRVWVATANGLSRFEPQTENFTNYTIREGLPDNTINSLQEDALGRLWIGTNKGLVRFDSRTGLMRIYDVSDGLPSNRFSDHAVMRARNGEMYFGTLKGLLRFHPDNLQARATPITVVLTEIRKFEQPFQSGPDVSRLTSLAFSWRDDLLSFDFAALGLAQPQKAQYAWKLEGNDQDWIFGGTKRTATYSNLPGGRYTLRVKATDETGRWHENQLAVQVNIATPPWQRWWAYMLYVFALTGIVRGYLRYRINQLHAINEARTQFAQQLITSQEAERKRIAAELHDGLGQSLLVIKNRTIIGKRMVNGDDKVSAQLEEISKATGQALEEVRSIAYNLRPYHLERLGLRESIEAMIEKIREATELKISARVALFDEVFSKDDEVLFYRVIQECLNNIIKHADATTVEISIVQTETDVTARIQDNGCGFAVSADSPAGGFGLIGLAERVRMLGGTHSISSETGKGTTVIVKIPRDRE
ncbi:MAG: two-component regulator propeller domain-containing protein [Blastocatellia bacterium]